MTRALLASLIVASTRIALELAKIIILVNKNVPASKGLAQHYCKVRGVSADNIVALDLPDEEDISRPDYDQKLAWSLRGFLKDRKDKIKCVLTLYGVPLRVGG